AREFSTGGRNARKCRKLRAVFPGVQPLDRDDHLRAGAVRGLVLVPRAQAVGGERGQQGDDLARLEIVQRRGRAGLPRARVVRLGPGLEARARPDAGAVAQELLELALVAVALGLRAAEDRLDALVLAEAEDRLAGREAVAVAGRLEAAVVEAAAEAHLAQDLR